MFTFGYAATRHGQVHHAQCGSGEPLLLLPGSARSWRQFTGLAPHLARDFRVIAVDTLGYGASAPFPRGGGMAAIAASVADLVEQLGLGSANVFGMHTGHKVAAALACDWPQLVRRLVLAGKSHSIIPDQHARNDAIRVRVRNRTPLVDGAAEPGRDMAQWARTHRAIQQLWWNEDVLRHPASADFDGLRDKIADELLSLPDVGAIYQANYDFDFAAALRSVRAPTLVLEVTHPSEDAAYGRQGELLATLMPNARATTLPSVDEVGLGCNADPGEMARCVAAFLKGGE